MCLGNRAMTASRKSRPSASPLATSSEPGTARYINNHQHRCAKADNLSPIRCDLVRWHADNKPHNPCCWRPEPLPGTVTAYWEESLMAIERRSSRP